MLDEPTERRYRTRSVIRRILQLVLVLPLLMACVAFGGVGGPGLLVLCTGAGGHIAIETSHQACDDSGGTGAAMPGLSADPACSDLPLPVPEMTLTSKTSTTQIAPPLASPLPLAWGITSASSPGEGFCAAPRTSAPPQPPALACLRAVVLLV